ncbi:MAG: MerR family transcriptional regulator [Acidobacteriota bacterium]|jgi:DNA-binding transcriptional MerR regulator
MPFVPKKLYYRIGEVCEIVGVEAHVLRYWETEFPALAPPKNKAGQRTYRPKDIELLLTIRKLLYDEGFTIAGARKQLTRHSAREGTEASKPQVAGQNPPKPAPVAPAQRLNQVREELENILTLLERE